MDKIGGSLRDFLNPHQKRALVVSLYQLEKLFRETDEWLKGKYTEGILYSQHLILNKRDRQAGQELIQEGLKQIAGFAQLLGYEKLNENMSAAINSALHVEWANFYDLHAVKHKRSGEVHPELVKLLDPLVDDLIAIILRLIEIAER